MRVDEIMKERANMAEVHSPAIITDIDETFLDNSPNAVHQALLGKDYEPAAWAEWTSKANADTMSGALAFYKYAASKGISIFYITNRDEKDKAGTLANLKRFGFPYADEFHMLVRTTTSGKEERRQQVAANYDILLLLGDNLSDFSALFDKKTEAERDQNVYSLANQFGKKFIILPNFNYGGWEDAIYDNRRDWTPAQKDSLLRSKLKSY
jgi:5'-nucleotidase (lipoprotein e(P4) family)